MNFPEKKRETISTGLRNRATELGINLSPVVETALQGIQRWETFLMGITRLEEKSGREIISMGSLAHRGGKTHGLGVRVEKPKPDDINKRMDKAMQEAAEARAKSIDSVGLNLAAQRAVKIGYVSPGQARSIMDDIDRAGGVVEYYRETKKDIEKAQSRRDRPTFDGLVAKLMVINGIMLAEASEYPLKFAATMADKVFGMRGIQISKNIEQRKAEMAFCGETALNIHHAAFEALLSGNSAKGILVPEGYFEPLVIIPALYNGDIQIIPTHDNGYKLNADRLEKTLASAPKGSISALLLTVPCNPLGLDYSKEELEAIGVVAVKHGLKIIVDEQFAGLYHDKKQKSVSLASLTVNVDGKPHNLYQHTLTIQGTTKLFDYEKNKAGIACSGDTQWIQKIKDIIRRDEKGLTRQEVTAIGFAIDSTNIQENSNRLGRQLERLKKAIAHGNEIAGEKVFSLLAEPDSGFFTVLTIPKELGEKVEITNHEHFFLYALAQAGVEGRSIEGMGFDASDKLGMRINFSHVRNDNNLEKDDLTQAFTRLGKMARDIREGKAPAFTELMRGVVSKIGGNNVARGE